MNELTVEKLYKDCRELLELYLLTDATGLKKRVPTPAINRPGLALSGYTQRFASNRAQILGETEMAYLASLASQDRIRHLEKVFRHDIPFFIVTKTIKPSPELIEIANRYHTTVFQTRLTTADLITRMSGYLDDFFAPFTTLHGTLVDVYGVGMLYTGKSGVGKSECALDLIERGHRLVADDMVKVTKKGPNYIVGSGNDLLGHHMEVRGIGIIDIEMLFGIRAIRMQKRVEVEVRLQLWDETTDYERLGIEETYTTILGVEIPIVTVPVSPGKNITVISEVIAMNQMLKVYGENTAQQFSRKLAERMQRQLTTREYLQSDFE
ncbi:MAG: HPr(Ser) kinase/phosphatase [candidate division Zixibacteria bacterium]|jgi:HPr kinase/phosphorylase|nr:HPr(Ser) kinase/phosphatase [candidate division Zixibacteria bacterium]